MLNSISRTVLNLMLFGTLACSSEDNIIISNSLFLF